MIYFNFLERLRKKGKYKKAYSEVKESYLKRIRWAVSLFYFGMGLTFATWASRIPTIKSALNLTEAGLGTILFALPMGQLTMMLFSAKLVTRFGSNKTLPVAILLYTFCMTNLGLAENGWQLAIGLYFLGLTANLTNISVNTQGVYTEGLFRRNIMLSFHGVWSIAGFVGALVGLVVLGFDMPTYTHFVMIGVVVFILVATNYTYLINAKEKQVTSKKKSFFKIDSTLVWLGIIGFCSMASEGVMFDWSGVYFKEIIKVEGSLSALGYTSFMIMMACGRFFGDRLTQKWGRKKVMQISGCVISIGLFSAVLFPYLIPATLSFMVVGLGVSTIIPTMLSLAGKHPTIPTSQALTSVSSISFLGFLMGPPVIGYIAEAFGLQFSFAFIGVFGFIIALMVSKIKIEA